jgi:hypothetical protein
MCTVPRKNGTFRDSAHKGLQLLQENYMNTHSYTLFLQHSYTYIAIKHFKLCIESVYCGTAACCFSNI